MGHYIFEHLKYARETTIREVVEVNDQTAIVIPRNNNIKWNLGHIYVVHELFAFRSKEEHMEMPHPFLELFGRGTKPKDWGKPVPQIHDLTGLLELQVNRIQHTLEHQINESAAQPFTTSTGSLTLSTTEEFLSFCLYHEGRHIEMIKAIKRMIQSG